VGKPEGMGALEKPRYGLVVILRLILQRWNGVVWTKISLNRNRNNWRVPLNAIMNLCVPQNAGKLYNW
jgi:hypothetical protein